MLNGLVDQRIVEMKFDAEQFTDGVAQSVLSLDNLKKALNFTGVGAGIDKLGAAIGGISFSPLSNGLEEVTNRFNMLQYMGLKVLTDIANKITSVGEQLVKDFTITPVKTGLQEYETQINAIQTILANTKSKGTTLDEVNAALDELNLYADKTIYNFTQMTQNIGRFTAAGLDLKTSTSAIQGIANLAAVSGSTSQQASTAMYQLSQALSSGTVKLQDWNSVVNAGMGGELFQEQLKQTSREMVNMAKQMKSLSAQGMETKDIADKFGMSVKDVDEIIQNGYNVDVDALIKKAGSFRESLKKGWITSGVLAKTLNRITRSGALDYLKSHLKESSEYTMDQIKAMYDEASAADDADAAIKKLSETLAGSTDLTADQINSVLNLADTAEKAATEVKTFTQLMDTLKEAAQSGWTQTWEYLIGDFNEAKKLFTSISKEVGGLLGATSDFRNGILKLWHDMEGRDKMLSGLASGYKILKETMASFGRGLFYGIFGKDQEQVIKDLAQDLVDLSTRFSDFMKSVLESDKFDSVLGKMSVIGEAVGGVLRNLWEIFSGIIGVAVKFLTIFTPFFDIFLNLITLLASGAHALDIWLDKTNLIDRVFRNIGSVINVVKRGVEFLLGVLSELSGVDLSFFDISNFDNDPIKQWEAFSGIVQDLWHKFEEFSGIDIKMPDFSKAIDAFRTIKAIWDESLYRATSDSFLTQTDPLLSKLEKVYLLVTNIFNGIYSTFLSDGKWIDFGSFDQFLTHFEYIKDVGGSVLGVFKELIGIFFDFFKSVTSDGEATFSFSNALKNLGGAVKKVLDFFKPLGDVIFKAATAVKTFLSNLREKGVLVTIVNTIKTLWGYLTGLLSTLGSLFGKFVSGAKDATGAFDFQRFLDILKGIAGIILTGGFAKILYSVGKGFGWLANAFAAFGKSGEGVANILGALSNGIGKGGSGIVSSLSELVDGVLESFKGGDVVAQFKKIAVSIAILAGAIFVLSTIDGGALRNSCLAITTMFADIFGSIWLFYKQGGSQGNEEAFKSLTSSMIKLSAAVLIMSFAVKTLGKLNGDQATVAIEALTGIMLEMFLFAKGMEKSQSGFMDSAKSMIKISVAILILSMSIKSLGKLDPNQAEQGILALAGVFVIIGTFMFAMGKWVNPNLTKEVGKSLKQMAIGVLALCASVYILGKLDTDQLLKGLGAVAALILMLGIFAKLSEKSKGFVGKGLGIILIAAAMLIFADALKQMTDIAKNGGESFLQGFLALISIVFGLTVAFKVLEKCDVVKTAAGFLLVGKAMTAMAEAIFVIGNMPVTSLIVGFIGMAAALLVFGVAVKALAIYGPAILFVAGGFALMALGLLMLGPALVGVTAGLLALGGALPILVVDFIAAAAALLSGLVSLGPLVVAVLTKLIEIVCRVILGSVSTIVTTILSVAAELFANLSVLVPQVIHFATQLILGLIYGLISSMDAIIQAGIELMVSFVNGLANGLRENQDIIIGAVANLLSSILEMVIYAFQVIAEKIPGVGQGISDALEGAKQDVHDMLASTTAEAEQAGTAATEGYSSATSGIATAASTAMGNALSGIQNMDAWGSLGTQQGNAYGDNLATALNSIPTSGKVDTSSIGQYFNEGTAQGLTNSNYLVTDAASSNTDELLQTINSKLGINSPSTKGIEIGMYLDQGIAQGMSENRAEIFNVITEIFDSYMVSSEDQINQVNLQGAKLITMFVTGMRSKMPSVTSFFRTLSTSGALTLGIIMKLKFFGYGRNVVQGFVDGMNSKLQAVKDKAQEITNIVNSTVEKAEEIASPSKRFFRYGQYLDQGLILGMGSMTKDVARSSNDLGMSVVNSMSDAVRYAAAIADGEIELSPTIRPVMDLTYVQDGIAQINSLQTRTLALDATVTTSKWDTIDKLSTRLDVSDQTVQTIVKKLGDQSAKLDGLIDLLSNTNIVLDGDVVVGKLLPKIDKGLGRKTKAFGGRR